MLDEEADFQYKEQRDTLKKYCTTDNKDEPGAGIIDQIKRMFGGQPSEETKKKDSFNGNRKSVSFAENNDPSKNRTSFKSLNHGLSDEEIQKRMIE